MKKMFTFLILALCLWGGGFLSAGNRLMVLDFTGVTIDEGLTKSVTETFTTSLVSTGRYEVIEKQQIQKVLDQVALQEGDNYSDESVYEVGNLVKADLVIIGSVTKIGEVLSVSIRGITVASGIVRFARMISVDDIDDLTEETANFARELAKMNLTGIKYPGSVNKNLSLKFHGSKWPQVSKIDEQGFLPPLEEYDYFTIFTTKPFRRAWYTADGTEQYVKYGETYDDIFVIIYFDGMLHDAYEVEGDEITEVFLVGSDERILPLGNQ
jgi:TolB-like protein